MTIEQRLEILERHLKRSRRANRLLILGMVATACLAGAQGGKPVTEKHAKPQSPSAHDENSARMREGRTRLRTVEVDQLVVLDELGRPRIEMVAVEDGAAICLFDEEGKKRLELRQAIAASGVHLFDGREAPAVSLRLPADSDRGHLEIASSQGKSLLRADGVFVHDAAGQGRLNMSLVNQEYATLGVSQAGQTGASSIELTASGGARSVKLHDEDGYPTLALYAEDHGQTSLTVRHPSHDRSLELSTGPKDLDGPALRFFAPANNDGTGGLLPFLQLGLDHDRRPSMRIVDDEGRPVFTAPSQ